MTETAPPYDAGPASTRDAWMALAITVAATAVAMLVDRTVFELFNAPKIYDKDLGRLLRVMGFAGTWLAIALAVGFQHDGREARRTVARRRGWLLFWSPMLAGALAELLKIVVRRERPALNDGAYGFRPWDERTWSGAGLAFPSSHAAVAFGGAFMLARVFPRAKWVGIALAVGCGVTRIAARAHFVSDVAFAAGLGWLVSWFLWRKWQPSEIVPSSSARGAREAVKLVALAVALSAATSDAGAQAQPEPVGVQRAATTVAAPPSQCSDYEDCALGLLPSFAGISVVRGGREERLQTLGFFLPGGSLDGVFAGDSVAQRFGRAALRERRIAVALTATAIATVSFIGALDGDDYNPIIGLAVAGSAQALASAYFQLKADASLSRAVWAFNRQFSARPRE